MNKYPSPASPVEPTHRDIDITDSDLSAFQRGDRSLAQALQMEQSELEYIRGQARFYVEARDHERAMILLQLLESLEPQEILPQVLLARVLVAQGRGGEAEDILRGVESSLPTQALPLRLEFLLCRAEVAWRAGDVGTAQSALAEILKHDEDDASTVGRRAHSLAVLMEKSMGCA